MEEPRSPARVVQLRPRRVPQQQKGSEQEDIEDEYHVFSNQLLIEKPIVKTEVQNPEIDSEEDDFKSAIMDEEDLQILALGNTQELEEIEHINNIDE